MRKLSCSAYTIPLLLSRAGVHLPSIDKADIPSQRDHFDQKVEESLRRDLPIITTPHAKDHLAHKGDESFSNVYDLDFFQDMMVNIDSGTVGPKKPKIKVTGTPGKHVGDGLLAKANDILGAVSYPFLN